MPAATTWQSSTTRTVDAALHSLREASVTMAAAVGTLLCALAIAPGPGPAVLAVVLCLSLSRALPLVSQDVRWLKVWGSYSLPAR